jgi:hypothetical protein
VKRQGAQPQQAGIAAAQVVHRQPHPGGGERAHRVVAALRVVEFGVFQQFERDPVGTDARGLQRRGDARSAVGLQQHFERHVDVQVQADALRIAPRQVL